MGSEMVCRGLLGGLKLNSPFEGGRIYSRTLEAWGKGPEFDGTFRAEVWIKGASNPISGPRIERGVRDQTYGQSGQSMDPRPRADGGCVEKRPLAEGIRYLYLDALYVSLKCTGSYETKPFVAIGVDETMHKTFLGFCGGRFRKQRELGCFVG